MTDDDEIADADLAERVRQGDDEAYGTLWRRHSRAGLAAARPFASIADPDDLVSEAYLAIFRALRGGGGPREAFRPYLYRTIRNLAYTRSRTERPVSLEVAGDLDDGTDVEMTTVENTLTVRAFRTLPERWQTVLWYSEIEGMQPAEMAPLLGLSPNAAAALALRAREGLRKAWLQAHVSDQRVPEGCRWTVARMGEYARGGLTPRARLRFDQHLDGCTRCSILVEELDEVGGRLAVVLVPLVLGAGAALAWQQSRQASGNQTPENAVAQASSSVGQAAASSVRHPLVVGSALAGVAAVVVAAVAFAVVLPMTNPPSNPDAGSTVSPSEPAPSTEPTAAPTPPPDPTPTPPPDPAPPRRETGPRPVVPAPPPPPPADTTAPSAVVLDGPADASLGNDPSPEFRGRGEPGAVVEILVGPDGGPGVTTSTVVAADGSWSVRTPPLADGIHVARVAQVDPAGNRSAPVAVTLEVDTVALEPVLDPLATSHVVLPVVTGSAEPGATVELLLDGIPSTPVVAGADGRWSADLVDPRAATAALTVRQTDRAGNASPASAAVPLAFERPDPLSPASGAVVASTGGGTVVEVRFDGVAGRFVEVIVDGVATGNLHELTGTPLVRVTAPLADGPHVIGFRYVDGGRAGATTEVAFTIAP